MHTNQDVRIYRSDDGSDPIEVRIEADSVWLTRSQIAKLFGRDVKTIGKHINTIFDEGELQKEVVVAYFATTTRHGAMDGKTQTTQTAHYNLDVIISVGYRVKSKQGTQFRIWATNVLRDYLLKGVVTNQRLERIENNYEELSKEVKSITQQLQAGGLPKQGIFFDGQIFDAYTFVSDLIKRATAEIILIDNYIDETVLTLMTKRKRGVHAFLFTRSISQSLQLDIRKHNRQYPPITVHTLTQSHDRFLILDRKDLYHVGASLKDVGKKWFAFSKLDLPVELILSRLPLQDSMQFE